MSNDEYHSNGNGNGNGNGNVKSRFTKIVADIDLLKLLLNKLDKNVEKLADASVDVSKLIAKHEIRIEHSEAKSEHLDNEMHELNNKIIDIHKEIKEVSIQLSNSNLSNTNIEKLSNKVQNIERWKWYAGGAILAIASGIEYDNITKILLNLFK